MSTCSTQKLSIPRVSKISPIMFICSPPIWAARKNPSLVELKSWHLWPVFPYLMLLLPPCSYPSLLIDICMLMDHMTLSCRWNSPLCCLWIFITWRLSKGFISHGSSQISPSCSCAVPFTDEIRTKCHPTYCSGLVHPSFLSGLTLHIPSIPGVMSPTYELWMNQLMNQ